jgi:hypothetical protein
MQLYALANACVGIRRCKFDEHTRLANLETSASLLAAFGAVVRHPLIAAALSSEPAKMRFDDAVGDDSRDLHILKRYMNIFWIESTPESVFIVGYDDVEEEEED